MGCQSKKKSFGGFSAKKTLEKNVIFDRSSFFCFGDPLFCILPPRYIRFDTFFVFNTCPWRYGKWAGAKKWVYPKTGHFGTFLSKSGIFFGLLVQTMAWLRSARNFGSVCGPQTGVGSIVWPLETIKKIVFHPRRHPNRTPPTWGGQRPFSGNNQPPLPPSGGGGVGCINRDLMTKKYHAT